jgi:hypothetical protein
MQAGITDTISLIFTATDTINTRGAIRVRDPDFQARPFAMSRSNLSVTSSNASVGLDVFARGYTPGYTYIWVTSGELVAGDVVTLTYGDLLAPIKAYQAVECLTSTDADGDKIFAPIASQPRFDVLPHPNPDLMVATGPTYVQAGLPFTLSVRVLDIYGNPSIDFADTLSFTSTDGLALLPPDSSAFPAGTGVHEFSVTLNTTGFQYVYVEGAGPLQTNSNPFVVVDSLASQPQLFWGDLHGHHGHVYTSTLGQRVDEYMEYARDVSDLDFASQSAKSNLLGGWAEYVQDEVAESVYQYDEPGRFVTFRGYEWGNPQAYDGHHNVYFSGPSAGSAVYHSNDEASDTLDELWALLEINTPPGEEALTPPHALGYTCPNCWQLCDERELNRRYRPQAEVYSLWGNSETQGQGSARRGLAYGHRFGFYGSSDTHWGLPGNPQPEPFITPGQVGGLAAVYTDTLTRDALWQGLKQRRTYATEGARIFLDFTLDGYPMGSEIYSMEPPHIVVTAAGTADIANVEVVKGSYVEGCSPPTSIIGYYTTIYSATANSLTYSFEVTDEDFDSSAFYYVRVTQTDGKRAWSSPIWVDYGTSNNPPAANAGGPYIGTEDVAILFDGSASSDPDGDALSYDWDFGDGTVGTGVSVTHAYAYGGAFTVSLTVDDARGGMDSSSTTVTVAEVNDPPVADPSGPYYSTVGEPLTFDGSASFDPDNQDGTLANDQTLAYLWDFGDGATGTSITYSHAYSVEGDYPVVLYVSDGAVSDTAATTASVGPPNNPPAGGDVTASGDEDTVIPWIPSVSDPDGDILTCAIVAQPGNGSATVNADCSSGTYTPTLNFNGSDSFSYKANDGQVDSNTAVVSVTVNPVNDAPVADAQAVTTEQDTPVGITLTGSDADGDPLSYNVVTPPSHGELGGIAPNLTYTPELGYDGPDTFTFTVHDGMVDSDPATVSITVTPSGPPNQVQNGGFETDLSFWELQTFGDAAAALSRDDTTAGEGSASARVEVTAPGTFMRHVRFQQTGLLMIEGESYTLAFWAKASVDRPIRVLLRPTASPWIIFNTVNQDITTTWQRYEIPIIAGGSADDTTLEFSLGQFASTVWLDGIELWSSTANNAPVADDVTASGDEDTAFPWTPSVSDPDGDTLTCAIVAQPGNGSASVNADCSSGTYTPTLNFNGSDSFSYKANDGQVDSGPALVSVTVNPVNDAPVADAQSVTTEQDTPVGITLTGSDPDGDPLTYSVLTLPSHGELNGIAPNLTYTPDLGYEGADSFTFSVHDGTVDSDPATVSITVTPPGPPNQVQNGGFETDLSFWELQTYGDAAAAVSRDDTTAGEGSASARVEVTAPGTFLRHVRFQQTGLSLVEGESYTLAFWAKASVDRPIRVLLRPTSSPWIIFNTLNQNISTTWQRYEFPLIAGGSADDTTLEFSLGQFASTVWLDGIELSATGP